jgi:hypothetical protein
MPSTTMEHEDEYKLPKETYLPAVLASVTEKSYPYTKDGEDLVFTKWVWEFQITEGIYGGLRAWGETEPRLTNREGNKVRQWAETLLGTTFDIGQGLDTDDLLMLPCVVVVDHVKEPKKGSTTEFYYKTPVIDVLPAEVYQDDPPF